MAARRHTYVSIIRLFYRFNMILTIPPQSQPQRRYSTHHTSNLSFGDRIRKLLHIGRFATHGKPYYVDSRGRELDRSGRPIVKF